MSLTIWKYEITPDCTIEMPIGAEVLCVQDQAGKPMLWALVDTSRATKRQRKFRTVATGQLLDNNPGEYVGTFQLGKDFLPLVFHVFEVTK